MEEKMPSAEEKQNESELEDMETFVGMKKYYGMNRQKTTLSITSLYQNCMKDFKILFNNEPTSINKNKECFCAAAILIWQENPTRVWNTYSNVTAQKILI